MDRDRWANLSIMATCSKMCQSNLTMAKNHKFLEQALYLILENERMRVLELL